MGGALGDSKAGVAAMNSGAVAGSTSTNIDGGRSPVGSESKTSHQDSSSSAGNSSIRGGYQLGIWLSLFLAGLVLVPLVIWAVIRSVRSQEESQSDEVVYSNLNILQIYGKIVKKS
jgi:hypothetical protein